MCDCYTGKCEICGCAISLHIADFCTKQKNVHPYCHRCTRKILKANNLPEGANLCNTKFERIKINYRGEIVEVNFGKIFQDKIVSKEQVEGGKIGQKVLIFCDDPTAYGIRLN